MLRTPRAAVHSWFNCAGQPAHSHLLLLCSDGNLVASLMSHRMNVTQCNIAHALEKTK